VQCNGMQCGVTAIARPDCSIEDGGRTLAMDAGGWKVTNSPLLLREASRRAEESSPVQCSAVLGCPAQCGGPQCSAVQVSAVQRRRAQYSAAAIARSNCSIGGVRREIIVDGGWGWILVTGPLRLRESSRSAVQRASVLCGAAECTCTCPLRLLESEMADEW
jgi:hypothetical protein